MRIVSSSEADERVFRGCAIRSEELQSGAGGGERRSVAGQLAERRVVVDSGLQRRIVSCLIARHVPGVRRVEVEAIGGRVIVRGRVPSRHVKWLCLECCRHVAGVMRLVDQLETEPGRDDIAVDGSASNGSAAESSPASSSPSS